MATLKWQCNEIVWPFLFYESNPPGPLINKPKWFCEISDSAQAKTAWCQKILLAEIQNWLALCGVGLRAGLHCAESDSAQVKLRRVKQFFLAFKHLHLQGI